MAVKKDREYRDMTMEVRTAETEETPDERKIVTGYASTFNEPYTLFETDDWRFNSPIYITSSSRSPYLPINSS